MVNPFLIAHRVRGEPAFDVAEQMQCPECRGYPFGGYPEDLDGPGCHECDSLGYWWIIPTSGHRAYPYWNLPLQFDDTGLVMDHNLEKLHWTIFEMPPTLPDHYPTLTAPTVSLIDSLGLRKPKANPPTTPIARRF